MPMSAWPATTENYNRDVGDGWAGWAIAHPGFKTSVNPISTPRGGRLCPPHYYLPTQLQVSSYVPVAEDEHTLSGQ